MSFISEILNLNNRIKLINKEIKNFYNFMKDTIEIQDDKLKEFQEKILSNFPNIKWCDYDYDYYIEFKEDQVKTFYDELDISKAEIDDVVNLQNDFLPDKNILNIIDEINDLNQYNSVSLIRFCKVKSIENHIYCDDKEVNNFLIKLYLLIDNYFVDDDNDFLEITCLSTKINIKLDYYNYFINIIKSDKGWVLDEYFIGCGCCGTEKGIRGELKEEIKNYPDNICLENNIYTYYEGSHGNNRFQRTIPLKYFSVLNSDSFEYFKKYIINMIKS